MKDIPMSASDARVIYPHAPADLKIMLEEQFGTATFSANIIDRINSIEDACHELGIDFDLRHARCLDEYDKAETDIKIMAQALSEGKGSGERIWYPWFEKTASGFRLDVAGYGRTFSYVGARLKVDSREKALHLGKVCEAQYNTIFTTL